MDIGSYLNLLVKPNITCKSYRSFNFLRPFYANYHFTPEAFYVIILTGK